MTSFSRRALLANIFGTFGYASCLLLWTWIAVLYLPSVLDNQHIKNFLQPPAAAPVIPLSIPPALWPVVVALGVILTIGIVVTTIVVLLRSPVTIARTGKIITTKTADSLAPLVVRRQPLREAQRLHLTAALIKLIKLGLICIPAMFGILGAALPLALSPAIVAFVTSVLAIVAMLWFSTQYALADLLGVNPEKLV